MKNVIGGCFLGILGLMFVGGGIALWTVAVYAASQMTMNDDRYTVLGFSTFMYAVVGTMVVWLAEPSYCEDRKSLSLGQWIALSVLTLMYVSLLSATLYSWGFDLPFTVEVS